MRHHFNISIHTFGWNLQILCRVILIGLTTCRRFGHLDVIKTIEAVRKKITRCTSHHLTRSHIEKLVCEQILWGETRWRRTRCIEMLVNLDELLNPDAYSLLLLAICHHIVRTLSTSAIKSNSSVHWIQTHANILSSTDIMHFRRFKRQRASIDNHKMCLV